MLSYIKYRLGKKGKRAAALLATVILLCTCTGCDKNETGSAAPDRITGALPNTPAAESEDLQNSEADSSEPQNEQSSGQSEFDIDDVRKNIVIKGQTIEIPMKLQDLPKGWSYKLYDEKDVYLKNDQFLATMYYNNEEMYIAALENYNKSKPKESIIYNLTIYDNDCSIGGLTPQLSTKQDVVDKYGEPLPKVSDDGYYYYGIVNGENKIGGRLNNHCIGVRFTEDNIIKAISITYADLDKQY